MAKGKITIPVSELLSIQARVTKDQYNIIEKKADALGLSISNYIRMVCLKADINVDIKLKKEDLKSI